MLALPVAGSARAVDVVDLGEIPLGSIYTLLNRLIRKGLVSKSDLSYSLTRRGAAVVAALSGKP
jgi:DNA-binding PadR family transcriptional regulator